MTGSTVARSRASDRTLSVLRGQAPIKKPKRPPSAMGVMFSAMRGAAHTILARLINRSDISKLSKLRRSIMRDLDIRRSEVFRERKVALEKMKRIHAWQNRLDEKRCKSYRDSDTRDYRERMGRYDIAKIKPPLFGSTHVTLYDVEESRDWRQAQEERRSLGEPIEMQPIGQTERRSQAPAKPYVPRDERRHADRVAKAAKANMEQRQSLTRGRTAGRKRKPRPRRP